MKSFPGQFVRSLSPHPVTLLHVRGEDAFSYLQSQVSADLRGMGEGQLRYALWLDARGYVQADSFVLRQGPESFLLFSGSISPQRLREVAEANIIADDVEIDDLGSGYTRWALWLPEPARSDTSALGALPASAPAAPLCAVPLALPLPAANCYTVLCDSQADASNTATVPATVPAAASAAVPATTAASVAGPAASVVPLLFAGRNSAGANYDLLLPAAMALPEQIAALPQVDWACREARRIADGIAEIPTDIGPADFPQDGGDLPRVAVSTGKGCYLGQEMVARWHATGQVRSGLFRVQWLSDISATVDPAAASSIDTAADSVAGSVAAGPLRLYAGAKPVGELRSFSPRCGLGLALLRIHRLDGERLLSLAAGQPPVLRVMEPMLS